MNSSEDNGMISIKYYCKSGNVNCITENPVKQRHVHLMKKCKHT